MHSEGSLTRGRLGFPAVLSSPGLPRPGAFDSSGDPQNLSSVGTARPFHLISRAKSSPLAQSSAPRPEPSGREAAGGFASKPGSIIPFSAE